MALATIVALEGVTGDLQTGAKVLIRPDHEPLGSLGDDDLDRVVIRDTRGELAAGTTGIRHYGPNGEARQEEVAVFVESFAPSAPDADLRRRRLHRRPQPGGQGPRVSVTVCDARPVFATTQRFPWADEVVVDWPHPRLLDKVGPELTPRDAICVLTHDPSSTCRRSSPPWGPRPAIWGPWAPAVPPMTATAGSGRKASPTSKLATIKAPIGLDLGARTPEETAISICAEIIALRSGRTAQSLTNTSGDIHT